MKKVLLFIALLVAACINMKAQSLGDAISLRNQGRFLEAAKVLRPLADGGDSQAQALAATMFFKGEGVSRNVQQGLKYAKMSADQECMDGLEVLALYYYCELDDHYGGNNSPKHPKELFSTLNYYYTKYPRFRQGKASELLGECYLHGWGTEKNEDRAWELFMENSERLDKLIRDNADSWQAYQQRHPELFTIHDSADQMPSFPGGPSALNSYLANEITYPAICINNKIQGRPIVQFVVERNGSISSAKIVRSVDPALDKEALRVISSMPKWNPGKKNGVPVRVKYTIPVTFKLPNKR